MAHFVITYNIDCASGRQMFVEVFEKILTDFSLNKEVANQLTYFRVYSRRVKDLVLDLFNTLGKLTWREAVTVFYPKVTKDSYQEYCQYGRHAFKTDGSKIFSQTVFKA